MENGTTRIHGDRQTRMSESRLSDRPTKSVRSSDSDQFTREASDKLGIEGECNAQGLQSSSDTYQDSGSGACEMPGSANISGEYHSGNHARVIQAPPHAQEPHMVHKFPVPESPSGASGHNAGQVRPRNDHPARDVGTRDGPMSPTGERMASEATAARKRDSATVDATIRQDTADTSRTLHSKPQSAEHTASPVTSNIMHIGSCIQGARNEDRASQQGVRVVAAAPDPDNGNAVNAAPNEGAPMVTDAPSGTEREFDSLPSSSLPNSNSSQVEPEIGISSTPPKSRNEPTLASPVQLEREANVQSTPPTSPMKLSSPPPLKPLKKVNRIHTGLGAPFRNPWSGSIRRPLPSSPLPPSSPPPMPTSSPPAKRRRVDSDSEDRPVPHKVRRTGQSTSSPFVSPLRNAQAGSSSRTRPPAGGFSTPLRPSKTRDETFSSPILPSHPDVFTTPATAARSSPAYRPATASGSSPNTDSVFVASTISASSSYMLRPPRAVTRPFKPPAKSTRPTTATVQALRQRLQLLRNALRIRGLADPTRPAEAGRPAKATDDDELEALALRWRSGAREAAQDLWALVRDTVGEQDSWSSGDTKDGWGWSDKPQRPPTSLDDESAENEIGNSGTFSPPPAEKVHQTLVKNLSRSVVPRRTMLPPREDSHELSAPTQEAAEDAEPEENGTKYHTLGTMLTSLGIPHEVLGWQEEEGEFVD